MVRELGLLKFACCCWMLQIADWILCGGDSGVVATREIPVAVREVDRRVLLVHVAVGVELVTCDWSRMDQAARHHSQTSTPVCGGSVVDSTSTQGG